MSRRTRTSVACLCIVVVALAAFLPGAAALDYTVPELPWILLPDLAASVLAPVASPCDAQPAPLLSLVPPRAPPALA